MTYEQLKNDVRTSAFKKAGVGVLALIIGCALAIMSFRGGNGQDPNVGEIVAAVFCIWYFWWCIAVAVIRLIFPGMRANKLLRKQGKLDGSLKAI